jgi:predicted CoA-binding protein
MTSAHAPAAIAEFLQSKRIAVAGVSRNPGQAANAIFQKLVRSGYTVVPLNPKASEVEGVRCYANVAALPEPVDGVVVATHPNDAAGIVGQCAARGIHRIWFHRSFGQGSVADAAVRECAAKGIEPIVGGCPLMFCEPVDMGHKCMRWWLQRRGRVPRETTRLQKD